MTGQVLGEIANEVKHIAEQKTPLDLDDGVNVNYKKLQSILKEMDEKKKGKKK